MSLLAPWGLAALLAVPALVAFYFLRRRQPPRTVSALFLWKSPDTRSEAGPRLERFSRELSLLLEVTAAIAAALFLAGLRCGAHVRTPHTVAVLDTSLSMSAALPSGQRVRDLALEALARTVERDGGKVTVIASGPRPRVLGTAGMSRERLAELDYRPSAPTHDPLPAIALAREFAGTGNRIRFVTDEVPKTKLPDDVEVLAVGSALPNVALTAAQRVDADTEGAPTLVTIRVANFSESDVRPTVALLASDGRKLASQAVALAAGDEKPLRFSLAGAVPELEVRLEGNRDALSADDAVHLLPQHRPSLAVRVDVGGSARAAIQRFLDADGRIETSAAPALVFAGPGSDPGAWTVRVGASGEKRTALLGPFFADKSHPLLDAVPLDGVVWSAGESPPGRPLLTAGDAVLVSEAPGPVFHLNVDLERSNLQRMNAWPILLSNLLAMRRDALPGFARHNFALDDELALTLESGGAWLLRGPLGEQPLRGAGPVRLPPPGAFGRFELVHDGKGVDAAEVLPLAASESDLRARGAGVTQTSAPVALLGDVADQPQRHPGFLALMLAALALDWVLTGARKPGLAAKRGLA